MKRLMKGFTMIELLIVIAVLGVLAVAVLSAINPIEQINRGKDTGSRSDAEQLLSAIDRFYTTQNKYPWQATVNASSTQALVQVDNAWAIGGSAAVVDPITGVVTSPAVAGTSILSLLSSGGAQELKKSFVDRIAKTGYNPLYLYFSGTDGDSVYVCFQPKSGSFDTEALARCTAGLPTDLQFAGYATVLCDDGTGEGSGPYSCLP